VLSNHVHLVVTDRQSRLPTFSRFLGGLVARAVNAWLGRWESFWAPGSCSAVKLVSPGDIVAKTAYVLANPVAAGLVRSGCEWPGVWSSLRQIGAGPTAVDWSTLFSAGRGRFRRRRTSRSSRRSGYDTHHRSYGKTRTRSGGRGSR
jgi:hypothetical protein